MNEKQELFFKELRELLAKHKAELVEEEGGEGENVTVVRFNGTAENGWKYETVDLLWAL